MRIALKAKWVAVAALFVSVLTACGVLVDTTPPQVTVQVVEQTNEGITVRVRASDEESGVRYIGVHADVNGSLELIDDRYFTGADDTQGNGNGELESAAATEDEFPVDVESLNRSEVLEVSLGRGQHTLIVTATNGSNLSVEVEEVVGEPVVVRPVSVQALPVSPRTSDNTVERSEFTLPFFADGEDLTRAELHVRVNNARATVVDSLQLEAEGGREAFIVDGGQYLVGDELSFSVSVFGAAGAIDTDSFPLLTVVEEIRDGDVVVPDVFVQALPVSPRTSDNTVERSEFTLPFFADGEDLTRADLSVRVNGRPAVRLDSVDLEPQGGRGEFVVDGRQFVAGEELLFSVTVAGAAGATATAQFPLLTVLPDEVEPGTMRVNLYDLPDRVVRGKPVAVDFSVIGSGEVVSAELSAAVNGGEPVALDVMDGGELPFTGGFSLNTNRFAVGDSVKVIVSALNEEGVTAEASAVMRISASEDDAPLPAGLEVNITAVYPAVNGIVASDVEELEVHFVARSGGDVELVELLVRGPNSSEFKLLHSETVFARVVTDVFFVDATGYAAGDVYDFQVRGIDEYGREATSDPFTVRVVQAEVVEPEAPEISLRRTDTSGSNTEGVIDETWVIDYVTASDAAIQDVRLRHSINGEPYSLIDAADTAQGTFTVDGSHYSAGDVITFQAEVRTVDNGRAMSNVVTVIAVEPVYAPVEVSASVDGASAWPSGDPIEVDFVGSSGRPLVKAELLLFSGPGNPVQVVDSQDLSGGLSESGWLVYGGASAGETVYLSVRLIDDRGAGDGVAESDWVTVTVAAGSSGD